MGRQVFIAGNWKMNKTSKEVKVFFDKLSLEDKKRMIVICPPFTLLSLVGKSLPKNIRLGAQNMHFKDQGAFTGEISSVMLKDTGVKYVILGHSERRNIFGEGDKLINKKVHSALKHKLKVILCIGEKLEEREANKTFKVIEKQLTSCFDKVAGNEMKDMVIAYEPVWAIGTGKTAKPKQAEEVHAHIRDLLQKMYDKKTADKQLIIYGGSVTPENIKELMQMENIDGALLGGASLDPGQFSKICNF